MANGVEHLNAYCNARPLTVPVAGIIGGVVYYTTGDVVLSGVIAASVFAGYGLGYYVTPDLDLIGITSDESRMMRDMKLVGVLFVAYWLLYAYIMRFVGFGRKGHRNFFSHSYVGTAIRLAYILTLPGICYWYIGMPYYDLWLPGAILGVFVGLGLADSVHYYLDR